MTRLSRMLRKSPEGWRLHAQGSGMFLEASASQPDASVGSLDALRQGRRSDCSEKRRSAPPPSITRDSSLGNYFLHADPFWGMLAYSGAGKRGGDDG